MKPSQIGSLLLASVAVGLVTGYWWQKAALDDLRSSLLAAQKEEKLASARLSGTPAQVSSGSSETRLSDGRNSPPSTKAAPTRDVRAELANDAGLQALRAAAHRAAIGARYSPLFVALRLEEHQRVALQQAIALRDEALLDLNGLRDARQLTSNDPALITLRSQAEAGLRETAERLVGAAGYAELQQFEKITPIRDFVNDLVGQSVLSATPVDARTAAALVAAIDRDTGGIYRPDEIADVVLRVADEKLSPEQRAIVQAMIHATRGKRAVHAMASKR